LLPEPEGRVVASNTEEIYHAMNKLKSNTTILITFFMPRPLAAGSFIVASHSWPLLHSLHTFFPLLVLLDLPEQRFGFRIFIDLKNLSQAFDGSGFVTVKQVQFGQV